jgi:uncharacterized repeat protein (TIGR01451 family)
LALEVLEDRTLPSAVQVTLNSPATVVRGTDLQYTLTLTNTSNSNVSGLTLSDTLPSGTTLRSQNQTGGPAVDLGSGGNAITDTLTTLPAGASATINLLARANADLGNGTVLTDTVSGSDGNPADATSASSSTTVAAGIRIGVVNDQLNREGDQVNLPVSATAPDGTAVPLSVAGERAKPSSRGE